MARIYLEGFRQAKREYRYFSQQSDFNRGTQTATTKHQHILSQGRHLQPNEMSHPYFDPHLS